MALKPTFTSDEYHLQIKTTQGWQHVATYSEKKNLERDIKENSLVFFNEKWRTSLPSGAQVRIVSVKVGATIVM